MVAAANIQKGLQDVVALESQICFIDGRLGRLIYRGYDIRELAAESTFEEVAYLLWYGRLPTNAQLSELKRHLAELRALPLEVAAVIDRYPEDANPMDVLRSAVSTLAIYEPGETRTGASSIGGAQRLTAALPSILGQFHRRRSGKAALRHRPELSHAAYLLYAILDTDPSALDVHAVDVALILHADHELNASTFAARVTASTLSDLYSAVTSAVGTLKGPLHGGANERVMELLDAIRTPDRAEAVIKDKLAKHERIMGFGHRVYRVEDPRATILRTWSKKVGEERKDLHYYELLRAVETVVLREKGLYPNVDLYSGSVYTLLGIPHDLFTPIFASSRVSGWTAHVLEEYQDLRLIRPTAAYVGPVDQHYVPVGERE
ncbi:MAG: citrate/2-methylcitrate synthase [Thermoplasmata archaeon]